MSKCALCPTLTNVHEAHCPVVVRTNRSIWNKGYKDGKQGKEANSSEPAYMLGFERGKVDAESVPGKTALRRR